MKSILKTTSVGQTLVEIVVVIGVVVILTTALVILTTYSLKNTRLGGLRAQAVTYAQEGMDYVRQKRDASWTDFRALDGIWCIGDGDTWYESTVCTQNVNNFFGRYAEFTWDDANQRMAVTLTVDWTEGPNYYSTTLDSYFSQTP